MGPPISEPHQLHDRHIAPRPRAQYSSALLRRSVDLFRKSPASLTVLLSMRQVTIGQIEHHLVHDRVTVEFSQRHAHMQDQIRIRLGPAPDSLTHDIATAEVTADDVCMSLIARLDDPTVVAS